MPSQSVQIFPRFSDKFSEIKENNLNYLLNNLIYDENSNHFNQFKELIKKKFNKLLNIKTIIIGGTNGKGEVCYALGSLAEKQYNTAIWSSPHLLSLRERICINGKFVNYQNLEKLFVKNKNKSSEFNYYEFLFYNFLDYIYDLKVDLLILEVGVGGRLDAVNALNPLISVLTNISRDHQKLLGNTYKLIADEKKLISRKNNIFISSSCIKYVNQLIYKHKKNTIFLCNQKIINSDDQYSFKNKATALVIFYHIQKISHNIALKYSRKLIRNDLEKHLQISFWGRRNKIIIGNKEFNFIGAHNIDGMRSLSKYIDEKKIHFDQCYFAFSKKPLIELTKISYSLLKLKDRINQYFYCEFNCFKSLKQNEIIEIVPDGCDIINDWKNKLLLPTQDKQKILITGSYYFIGDVLNLLYSNIKS